MRCLAFLMMVVFGLPVVASPFSADVVVLGELHDNSHHHDRQARIVAQLAPTALVFEMLTGPQALANIPGGGSEALETAFAWENSGWPDFSMYYPIFAAAPAARVFGAAVPRDAARKAMRDGVAFAFGIGAGSYGLTKPLNPDEQKAREALQMAAHCDVMPPEMLPAMVNIQRLRDAELAKMALRAFQLTGGPVVVITGNGHARLDWGMPVYLARVAPDLKIVTLGQGEDGVPPKGRFDIVEMTPGIDRLDPCLAFR